jgi:hypothetical protein
LRKRKPSPKRLPPEAYRLPDWVLFGRPTMERPGGNLDYEERIRRYTQANDAYQRDLFLVLKAREVFAEMTPAPRGRRANPIREAVIAEFGRRRRAGEPSQPKDLLRWVAGKNFGQNALPDERTIRRWVSTKRT